MSAERPLYGLVAAALGVELLRRAWQVLHVPVEVSRAPARSLFGFSIVHLYAIFAALAVDAVLGRIAQGL